MDQLTPQDALRYEQLKKEALTDVLGFRVGARQSAQEYPRQMRRLLERASTKDTSAYLLVSEWTLRVAPEIEALEKARQAAPLRTTLAKQLRLSNQAAIDIAKRLVDERVIHLHASFLDLCYGRRGRARRAALKLLQLPSDDIATIRDRFVSYYLYRSVAREEGIVFGDAHAPLLKRLYQKIAQRHQVKRYKRRQIKRLESISARQQELKMYHRAIISRILLLELDTVLALDAYRQYKKQLDKLAAKSRTPAKQLSLFAAATKKIREAHTAKQSTTAKLADLQNALQAIDDVLVELFDMTDAQRNTLMTRLKEYRELEREAAHITKEQATYGL